MQNKHLLTLFRDEKFFDNDFYPFLGFGGNVITEATNKNWLFIVERCYSKITHNQQ